MRLITLSFIALIVCVFPSSVKANIITSDLMSDAYVTYMGLDWAWASPVSIRCFDGEMADGSCNGNELMLPSFHDGWRFATSKELALLQDQALIDLLIPTANTTVNASAYWNTSYTHVDPKNLKSGFVISDWLNDFNSSNNYFETFYVRDAFVPPSPQTPGFPGLVPPASVPEPNSIAMLAIALMGLAGFKRIRQ